LAKHSSQKICEQHCVHATCSGAGTARHTRQSCKTCSRNNTAGPDSSLETTPREDKSDASSNGLAREEVVGDGGEARLVIGWMELACG